MVVYIHNCPNGEFHCGYFKEQNYRSYRTIEYGASAPIITMLEIHLDNNDSLEWKEIDKLINEAYLKIRKLPKDTQYGFKTSTGYFGSI